MKLYAALAQALADGGHRRLFGVMGDANMHYITRFAELGGEFVYAVDEGAAVSMADGYARITDRPSVATVTNGPGITNAITALIEAARTPSPVVLITGRTVRERGKLQEVDVRGIATLCGIAYRAVLQPRDVADEVAMAIGHAAVTRSPVLLDVENSFLNEEVSYERSRFATAPRQRTEPDSDALDAALGVIATSRRPVVLAGRGAVDSGAAAEIAAFAEVIDAPVATTLLGKDSFIGNPYNVGIVGSLSNDIAIDTITMADCLVTFGASLNRYTSDEGALLRGKAIVACDISPSALGANVPVSAAIVGDARVVAARLREGLAGLDPKPWSFRSEQLRQRIAGRRPADEFKDRSTERTIDMRTAIVRLDELLPADRALVTDCGRFLAVPWRFLHVRDPARFTHTVHFGSMGLGIATAVGASLAAPDRLTVAVVGDAGGMMGLIELTAAVRHQLPLVVVVLNDGSWGSEYSKLQLSGLDPKYSLVQWPSFQTVAEALGSRGLTVRKAGDLDAVPALLDARPGPVLIDVIADPAIDHSVFP